LRHAFAEPDPASRVVQGANLAGVIKESVWIAQLGLETELVGNVVNRIAVVNDVDLVQDIVAELKKIRSASWPLEGNIVRD
jgi:hypothetical protein